ncbi:MAG: hypothetical protein PHW62_00095 [Candidatus Ratteibacteria bacterium]|nr:hypothetical protein [Candidatus Ratteibacteria bacterium]
MILLGVRIIKTAAEVFMHRDDMKKYRQLNISYEFSMDELAIDRLKLNGADKVVGIPYSFSIIYTNPSMGRLNYQGEVDCQNNNQTDERTEEDLRNEIAYNITLNILPVALIASTSLGLPPPFPLPAPPRRETTKKDDYEEIRGYG